MSQRRLSHLLFIVYKFGIYTNKLIVEIPIKTVGSYLDPSIKYDFDFESVGITNSRQSPESKLPSNGFKQGNHFFKIIDKLNISLA